MSRLLPLFPLNLVVFPGEKLNLHIFEPRYRQLVHDCLHDNLTFGIPPYLNDAVQPLGTEMRLVKIERLYPTGESDIRTEAVGLFRLTDLLPQAPGKLYAGGYVADLADEFDADAQLKEETNRLLNQLYDVLGLGNLLLKLPADFNSYDIGHHIGLSTEQEYQLLELRTEIERQRLIVTHLQQMLPTLHEAERLKERVRQNGHFKHLTPPNF